MWILLHCSIIKSRQCIDDYCIKKRFRIKKFHCCVSMGPTKRRRNCWLWIWWCDKDQVSNNVWAINATLFHRARPLTTRPFKMLYFSCYICRSVRCRVPKRADVSLVPSEVRKQHVSPNRRKWTQRAPIFPSVSYSPERRKAYAPNPNPIPAA